jgi:hypothetical protein
MQKNRALLTAHSYSTLIYRACQSSQAGFENIPYLKGSFD